MKTLIVEDDVSCCILLERILSPFGNCDIAINGKEGFDLFEKAHDEKQPYDLMCLDIMMPVMDGRELLKKIREWECKEGISRYNGVKVILTTALDNQTEFVKSLEEHCEAYIMKPVHRRKLLNEIGELGLLEISSDV